jgi:predicted dehydrogenase
MTRRPLGVGIVGAGGVTADWHLPALRLVPDIDVVAIADTDEAAARRGASLAGLDRGYRDYTELLADSRVEVVAVCVPTRDHVEVAQAAFEAGRHVLVEKPPALALDDWTELLVAERRAGTTSMLATNMRHLPAVRRARAAIAAGRIGRVRGVTTTLTNHRSVERGSSSWRSSRLLGGGALVEKAVHHVDLWRYLLDCEVDSVAAWASVDDLEVSLMATMEDGTVVSTLACDRAVHTNKLTIVGTDGRLEVEADRAAGLGDRLRARRTGGAYLGSFVSEWTDFAQAIRTGQPAAPSLSSGRALLQVVLAASESASTGALVRRVDAPSGLVH